MTPAELKAALQGAYGDRLDAAVAAGKITKAQADEMKQRSTEDGGLPFFGGGHGRGFGHGQPPSLDAAATYLGLTQAELRTQLEAGKTLAEIAGATTGKTVAGLESALAAASKAKLDAAVKAGKLTQAQADAIQTQMTAHLDDLVNGTGHGFGGTGTGTGTGADLRPQAGPRRRPSSCPPASQRSAVSSSGPGGCRPRGRRP